ncbi:MAG: hypothetical protein JJE25_06710 [Bacteroidia bacterium]|nr:hypothetical protein [Bacteroidia bacterium]
MEEGKKYFIVPPGDGVIQQYAETLDIITRDRTQNFSIKIPPSAIAEMEVGMMAEMLAAAQHKKKWIEFLILGIDFDFMREENSDRDFLSRNEWRSSKEHQQWFCHMYKSLPFVLFFLRQDDARLFALQGDFLHDMLREQGERISERKMRVEVSAEKIQLINNRLFWACSTFYTFCSGMHIDAETYIEAMIAELQGNFSFKHIINDWLKNEYKIEISKRKRQDE